MKKILLSVIIVCVGISASFAQSNRYNTTPILLDTPNFNGMCLQSSNKAVSLKQLSKVANGITDTDVWIKKHLPEKLNSSSQLKSKHNLHNIFDNFCKLLCIK